MHGKCETQHQNYACAVSDRLWSEQVPQNTIPLFVGDVLITFSRLGFENDFGSMEQLYKTICNPKIMTKIITEIGSLL